MGHSKILDYNVPLIPLTMFTSAFSKDVKYSLPVTP